MEGTVKERLKDFIKFVGISERVVICLLFITFVL